ncbi:MULTISPECIES: DNA polymerase III subunit gamma and tau [unclassified Corynebacterium]|uniref:DNA polymerase III subunit gamma and tau n=1 Tax=unclassified Corynebacterium TaxID=2624378 RepID=UPI0029C9E618|nr:MULTISPECIES: DNA polymerase III subunit gamma and tau [unclassified Corynebacterium]WPF65915.1 DNA polymerase III subunit gamma and tau [Corynebacterium sp. 22KM0430]WPF68408.1 DNA polymerase III subunit gamma and tau [Corynebacterium sp. 21KM1197]
MSLYRKYRPASFAEVVGQEQVTRPLSAALDSGRINHAYLFSGPRGCGKTSSARILARSLNCVHGPTSTPCGECASCRSLAPGGPGNLDVTELDAASHNGVEDMRELRDRAYYAPADSRYRVFIIDEAHMISNAGSNALLKIVEEPPEHLIFIFATTEPEKVIGTIRSRTHHYPFRLLTPQAMKGLLARTVESEGMSVEDSVYPLVIRAGGGSPRDSLSILDQLLAGAGPQGLTYQEALPLLGVTDLSLLDATVEALAEGDKPRLFNTIDEVIETGIEPRRFVTDLLDRLRDLMVLEAVPEALEMGLVDAPTDRAEVLRAQAARFTGPHITRLADQVNSRITDLRGATSPRLLLEILAAHLLLPAEQPPAPLAASPQHAAKAAAQAATAPVPEGNQANNKITGAGGRVYERPSQRAARQQQQPPQEPPAQPKTQEPEPTTAPAPASAPKPQEQPASALDTIRREWARLRESIGARNRVAQIMLTEASVLGIREDTLVLGHNTGALAARINADKNNKDIADAVTKVAGRPLKVHCVVGTDPSAQGFEAAPVKQKPWNPTDRAAKTAKPTDAKETREPSKPKEPTAPEEPARSAPVWGKPAALGGKNEEPQPPAPQAAPPAAATPPRITVPTGARRRPDPVDEVPLPPEPDDAYAPPEDIPPPPEPQRPPSAPPAQRPQPPQPPQLPQQSSPPASEEPEESEEEEMLRAAASEPGSRDRRDAMTVVMELLSEELGAKPL